MKVLYYIYIILLLPSLCWSQELGFKKIYAGTTTRVTFVDILWDGEKLITTGQFLSSDTLPNGALNGLMYMELDTNGNTLHTDIYYRPNVGITSFRGNDATLRSNNDVLVATQLINDPSGLVCTYRAGELISAKTYNPLPSENAILRNIVELPDGLLIAGSLTNINPSDGLLIKTDSVGNIIWERDYSVNGLFSSINEPYIMDANTILLPGGISFHDPPLNSWSKSRIVTTDSLGIIKKEWQSVKNKETGIKKRLLRLPNSNWLYTTTEVVPLPQFNDRGYLPKLVCRDSNFNLVWERTLTTTALNTNYFSDLIATADGNFITIGSWQGRPNLMVHKFSPTGSLVWTYFGSEDLNDVYEYDFGGVVEIPSGSIFTAGLIESISLEGSAGVLIKLSPNGCIDADCDDTKINNTLDLLTAEKIRVFPNPTSDLIQVTNPIGGLIEIFDVSGKLIKSFAVTGSNQMVSIKDIPSGTYFLKMHEKTLQVTYQIVKI